MTNEEGCNRIQNATGVHDNLLTMVKKRKLRWYGHISRSSGMAKTILQGTVKGARRRGRQKKRWEDKIKEWTGMGFGDFLRAAEDREGWKGIAATSFVVIEQITIFIDQLIEFLPRDKDRYPHYVKSHQNVHAIALKLSKSSENNRFRSKNLVY